MGRNWLSVINPDWKQNILSIFPNTVLFVSQSSSSSELQTSRSSLNGNTSQSIEPDQRLTQSIHNMPSIENEADSGKMLSYILIHFPKLMSNDSEVTISGFEVDIVMENYCSPIFHKAYSVPLRLRDKVEIELNHLVETNILTPVRHSKWASPIVIVTINKYIKTEHYPLPNIEDIFASLSNCKYFCVLDLSGAYQQLKLSEKSKEFVTINTLKGLFRYNRLTFGVASAPSIFQSVVDQILVGINKVCCYLDDIIIGGATIVECQSKLYEVLIRLNNHCVKINAEKCRFMQKSVSYLGHILEYNCVRPNEAKIQAVLQAPSPKNIAQLQSYLGLINYYRRFIPNLASELKALYSLLEKDKEFIWSVECNQAFERSKKLVTTNKVLELYDPNKPIIVASDASPYGVGAVLSHLVNGVEKPVLFASSSLSPAEKN